MAVWNFSLSFGMDRKNYTILKPGGAHPFLSIPIFELNDLVVESDLIWGSSVHSLRDRILETQNHHAKFRILEEFLLKQFNGKNNGNIMVHSAIRKIQNQNGEYRSKLLQANSESVKRIWYVNSTRLPEFIPNSFHGFYDFKKRCTCSKVGNQSTGQRLHWIAGITINRISTMNSNSSPDTIPPLILKVRGEYVNFIPIKE